MRAGEERLGEIGMCGAFLLQKTRPRGTVATPPTSLSIEESNNHTTENVGRYSSVVEDQWYSETDITLSESSGAALEGRIQVHRGSNPRSSQGLSQSPAQSHSGLYRLVCRNSNYALIPAPLKYTA